MLKELPIETTAPLGRGNFCLRQPRFGVRRVASPSAKSNANKSLVNPADRRGRHFSRAGLSEMVYCVH